MAIANKYLEKEDIKMPKLIRDNFEVKKDEKGSPITYHKLFMEYLNDESREIDPNAKEEDGNKGIVMRYITPSGKTNRFYIDKIAGEEKRIL